MMLECVQMCVNEHHSIQISLQELVILACCFSLALYEQTMPRQEGNQCCRNQYSTQYIAILSQESAMTTQQVVKSKMSNLPLGLFLCVICATALG